MERVGRVRSVPSIAEYVHRCWHLWHIHESGEYFGLLSFALVWLLSQPGFALTRLILSLGHSLCPLSDLRADLNPPLPFQAIRKKIESELSRKRPAAKRTQRSGAGQAAPRPKQGTVSALRPLPALTVPHSISVADASQLCAAKRTDCVLVVDEEEHLCGIFTAKDLAFRVSLAEHDGGFVARENGILTLD